MTAWHLPTKPLQLATGLLVTVLTVQPLGTIAQAHSDGELHPDFEHFYVGVDGFPTLRSGTYLGLPNPNYNRLTFLFPHVSEANPASNHFHGIGAYSYTGAVSRPIVTATNLNNRIPEISTGQRPLTLYPGSGAFAGRQVTQRSLEEYSNLEIGAISTLLSEADPGAAVLYTSSSGRWQGSLADAVIALELVDVTPGLNVANAAGETVLAQVGDRYTIGTGDAISFLPTLWTDAAAYGTYTATFRLRNLSAGSDPLAFGDSGSFNIQVEAVPEPSIMLGMGTFGLLAGWAKRRAKQPVK